MFQISFSHSSNMDLIAQVQKSAGVFSLPFFNHKNFYPPEKEVFVTTKVSHNIQFYDLVIPHASQNKKNDWKKKKTKSVEKFPLALVLAAVVIYINQEINQVSKKMRCPGPILS